MRNRVAMFFNADTREDVWTGTGGPPETLIIMT
jgi:hypothetical protein